MSNFENSYYCFGEAGQNFSMQPFALDCYQIPNSNSIEGRITSPQQQQQQQQLQPQQQYWPQMSSTSIHSSKTENLQLSTSYHHAAFTTTTTTTTAAIKKEEETTENFSHYESPCDGRYIDAEVQQEQQQQNVSIYSWLESQHSSEGNEDSSEDWEELIPSLSPCSSTSSFQSSSGSPCKSDFYSESSSHHLTTSRTTTTTTSKWRRKKEYELTLPVHVQKKRRLAANARERKRMTNLNEAFERLRHILPTSGLSDQGSKPISKMDALQMAQAYIKELSNLLG